MSLSFEVDNTTHNVVITFDEESRLSFQNLIFPCFKESFESRGFQMIGNPEMNYYRSEAFYYAGCRFNHRLAMNSWYFERLHKFLMEFRLEPTSDFTDRQLAEAILVLIKRLTEIPAVGGYVDYIGCYGANRDHGAMWDDFMSADPAEVDRPNYSDFIGTDMKSTGYSQNEHSSASSNDDIVESGNDISYKPSSSAQSNNQAISANDEQEKTTLLKEYKDLLDNGIITQEEFDAQKRSIILSELEGEKKRRQISKDEYVRYDQEASPYLAEIRDLIQRVITSAPARQTDYGWELCNRFWYYSVNPDKDGNWDERSYYSNYYLTETGSIIRVVRLEREILGNGLCQNSDDVNQYESQLSEVMKELDFDVQIWGRESESIDYHGSRPEFCGVPYFMDDSRANVTVNRLFETKGQGLLNRLNRILVIGDSY